MFKPYVSAKSKITEFSLRSLVLGLILGLIFAIGNAYLALKVGTTVSASIPAAVLSMAILRTFFKRVTILENNLVQTIASVGEGLAAGVVFTVPALFLLGESISSLRIFILSSLGGILGVLLMIPMRRYIIVKEHNKLPFPEGTACAEILKSGESSGPKAFMALVGIFTGAVYKLISSGLHLFRETFSWIIPWYQRTEFSFDGTPALLGVGFIIGPRIASVLFAGGAFGWWILIPLIRMFDTGSAVIYPATTPVALMTADEIWSNYIRYIGAGSVATGGLLCLFNIIPLIWKTIRHGFKELIQTTDTSSIARTDRDISLRWLIFGSIAIILTLWLMPGFQLNFLTIVLLAVLGFFFVAVTSLTVGIVGSTSNPVSGMTITTLLITCLIFVALGWTERLYLIAALTMAIVANVAICLAATTSQDLKTGYIVGATPRAQQLAEIIGVFLPALAIGGTVYLLNEAYGFGSKDLPAPQGTMMALIAKGVIQGNIPFTLVSVGIVIALLLEVLKIPILPFAVGLYLPLSLSTPIMLGGIVSFVVRKMSKKSGAIEPIEQGVLASSGLVAGDACMGVVLALFAVLGWLNPDKPPLLSDTTGMAFFILLAVGLVWFSLRSSKKESG